MDGIPLAIEFAAAREPVAEHNDMVKAIPPDRTVPMPGKMSRSATRPPFGLPEGAGSRPHLASVFQGRRKSNNIHASSGVIWGIPAKILPQIPLGRLGEPEEIAGYHLPVLGRGGVRDRRQYRDQWRPAHAIAGTLKA